MAPKHTVQAREDAPAGADDLTRIRGIGPGIQQRLYAAGIVTFEQLAGVSAAELAGAVSDVAGMSADLIRKKDWVGQAQTFAEEQATSDAAAAAREQDNLEEMLEEETVSPARQHYATFTVELLLGDERDVRRTRVRHVQGGGEIAWPGWNAARLIDFFTGQAALEVAEAELEIAVEQPSAAAAEPESQPAIAVRSLEVLPEGGARAGQFLAYGEPFEVRLALDVEQNPDLPSQPLTYDLVVHAKDFQSRSHRTIGETRGELTPGEPGLVRVLGVELPRGIFRLETAVTVELPTPEGKSPERLTAFQEGQLFQVY